MPEDTKELQKLVIQLQRELWQLRAHLAQRELAMLDFAEQQILAQDGKDGAK